MGSFWSVTKLIFSRYIFNSFPFIAPPRQKRNASNHFLPQQNSCGNLKYCGMSGQATAWSLSFSPKWNSYPLIYGTNSTTKRSLGCASISGEESGAGDLADHHQRLKAIACGRSNPLQPRSYKRSSGQQRERPSCAPRYRQGEKWLQRMQFVTVPSPRGCFCSGGSSQVRRTGVPCLATHWKWLFARQEVTIILCGLNFLSPFKCYFKLGLELLAAGCN